MKKSEKDTGIGRTCLCCACCCKNIVQKNNCHYKLWLFILTFWSQLGNLKPIHSGLKMQPESGIPRLQSLTHLGLSTRRRRRQTRKQAPGIQRRCIERYASSLINLYIHTDMYIFLAERRKRRRVRMYILLSLVHIARTQTELNLVDPLTSSANRSCTQSSVTPHRVDLFRTDWLQTQRTTCRSHSPQTADFNTSLHYIIIIIFILTH